MLKQLLLAPLLALSFALAGCAGTQVERKESADQIFGKAKVVMMTATVAVGAYNVLCADTLSQSAVCARNINEIVNAGLAGTADAIASAERVFAAANSTDAAKLDAAKGAIAAVNELVALVAKYGISKLGQG